MQFDHKPQDKILLPRRFSEMLHSSVYIKYVLIGKKFSEHNFFFIKECSEQHFTPHKLSVKRLFGSVCLPISCGYYTIFHQIFSEGLKAWLSIEKWVYLAVTDKA